MSSSLLLQNKRLKYGNDPVEEAFNCRPGFSALDISGDGNRNRNQLFFNLNHSVHYQSPGWNDLNSDCHRFNPDDVSTFG